MFPNQSSVCEVTYRNILYRRSSCVPMLSILLSVIREQIAPTDKRKKVEQLTFSTQKDHDAQQVDILRKSC